MDEQTQHILAGLLTVAYYAGRQREAVHGPSVPPQVSSAYDRATGQRSEDELSTDILHLYQKFSANLTMMNP